jgi:hypothetical protein
VIHPLETLNINALVILLCLCCAHIGDCGIKELTNGSSLSLTGAKRSNFSDVTLNHNQKPTGSVSERPYINFYNCYIAGRTKDSADGPDVSTHQLDPSSSVAGSRDDRDSSVKDMEGALRIEATLILRWKVIQ